MTASFIQIIIFFCSAERNGRDPDDIFEAIMYLNDDDARN